VTLARMHADFASLEDLLTRVGQQTAGFRQSLDTRPVAALSRIDQPAVSQLSDQGLGADGAVALFQDAVSPHISGSPGPRYFGFVTGGSTPAALAGDWLASAADQNLGMPGDSAASQLTEQTIALLLDLFDLPPALFDGAFTSGATASNVVGLSVGRAWCAEQCGIDVVADGALALGETIVFAGTPHATLIKAMGIIGIGRNNWQGVSCLEGTEAIDPVALADALAASDAPNKIVAASAGTVTATDFDDLNAVADLCAKHGAWLHVDAAFGLFARTTPALSALVRGMERAGSICADGHKWLNVPYESGLFFTKRVDLLEQVFGVGAAYLTVDDPAPMYLRRGLESSQRWRALPAWMTLQAYGRAGVREIVENNCRLAAKLGDWIETAPGFVQLSPTNLHTVLFAVTSGNGPDDDRTAALLSAVNATGEVFMTPGAFGGRGGIRAAISNWITTDSDIDKTCAALSAVRAQLG